MSIATISPKQLYESMAAGQSVDVIDVRTPVEYREVHATCARNVPLDQLDVQKTLADRRDTQQPLYVICKSGSRGRQACEKLMAAGGVQVINVEGGTQAWEAAGLPLVRGKKAMSLERQVRIAAGMLVLLGTGLGAFVHPYFLGVAAFVGAGLVFAGITDTCGMGMMLARMPWNQVKETPGTACAAK